MLKITLTGACGFIGSHLAKQLIADGFYIQGVDNFDDNLYSRSVKENRLKELVELDNFHFENLDISKDELDSVIEGSDYVINEAAIPGQVLSWRLFEQYVSANIIGAKRVIDSCIRNNVKQIVQASTSSVYGKFAVGDETKPTNPISPYGVTKLAAENLLFALTDNSDLNFTILRYFSVYGPGQRPDMAIQKFLTAIKKGEPIYVTGDGSQKRDLTYVGDVVAATISALGLNDKKQIFNISGGVQYTLNQIIEKCFTVLQKQTSINYLERPLGDQEETFGDNSKAKKILNFNPKVSLEAGLVNQSKFLGYFDL